MWEGFLLGANSVFKLAAVSVAQWSVGVNACLDRIGLTGCYLAEFVADIRPSSSGSSFSPLVIFPVSFSCP